MFITLGQLRTLIAEKITGPFDMDLFRKLPHKQGLHDP